MQIDWVFLHRLVGQTISMGVLVVFTICLGCAKPGNAFLNFDRKVNHGEDLTLLEKGFVAYENGDINGAAALFQKLYNNSGNRKVRQHALYGLSIARLCDAKTPEEFKRAHALWQEWRESREISANCEDPIYMEPFLFHRFPISADGSEEAFPSKTAGFSKTVSLYQYDEMQKRAESLETELKRLEEKYKQLKAEKESLAQNHRNKDATIQTLKEKIKALEVIDQKIQEKKNKTEISSPE